MLSLKNEIKKLIENRKGSDDKNSGTAMAIIFAVVIGFILVTSFSAFFNDQFLPQVFDKITGALNNIP